MKIPSDLFCGLFDSDELCILKTLYERYAPRSQSEISVGRNRICINLGAYIIKLPRNGAGFIDNDWEGSISNAPGENTETEIQYPHTRLFYVKKKVPILFMETVTPAPFLKSPEWVYAIDSGQVGYTKRGRLVAYDYGIR